ncbi:MAG: ABC transporter permease [Gemmatimonadetes bacterium]|nr:ABC transporter permease [Gemmatimonadota bacterium]
MELIFDAIREAIRLLATRDPYVMDVLARSLEVSGVAILIGALIGVPAGVSVGLGRFRGRNLLVALVHTGFALPPTVVGLFVYLILSRSGPLGVLELLYTTRAMILAQVVIATPYIAGITLAAIQAVPRDAGLQARALGASRWQAVIAHVREARLGMGAALIAGFGSIFSEVGAVMIVGGNVLGETRVLTTAIVLETRRGNFAIAMALGLIVLLTAFAVNLFITRLQQRRAGDAAWPATMGRTWA